MKTMLFQPENLKTKTKSNKTILLLLVVHGSCEATTSCVGILLSIMKPSKDKRLDTMSYGPI